MAIKFNPTFLLPVVSPGPHATSAGASEASPARASPARRKNAASEIRSASPATGNPALAGLDAHKPRLQGFRRVSLLQMVTACGQTPLVRQDPKDASIEAKDLETLAKTAQGPLVVFPEVRRALSSPDLTSKEQS